MNLRPYQAKAVDDIRSAFARGFRSVLYVLPTGGGKGVIIPEIVRGCVAQGKRVVFIVSRRALVQDMSRRLYRIGVNHGLYLGAQTRQTHLPVVVASIDTLRSRAGKQVCPRFDLALIDEAHLALSDQWRNAVQAVGNPPLIGFTATPVRLDGKGLGNLFDTMVLGPTVQELIDMGFLVPTRVFAPSIPDLTGIKSIGGDFAQDELEQIMSDPRLVGDTVTHWKQLNEGQPTIGFAVNRRHAALETAAFNAAGIRAEFLDGTNTDAERDRAWARLRSGETKVVWTVMIASYGFDEPCIKHGIFSRPTQSLALWLQQCGRIIRPFEDARYAIIQDHTGNTLKPGMGFVEEEREWTLDDKKRRGKSADEIMPPEMLPKVCPECKRVARPHEKSCPSPCGYVFAVKDRAEVEQVDGKLLEIKERPVYGDAAYGASEDPAVNAIISLAKSKGWKPGAVYFRKTALTQARTRYQEIFGTEPKNTWSSATIEAMIERKALAS